MSVAFQNPDEFGISETEEQSAARELALAKERSAAREQKDLLEGLIKSPGGAAYVALLEDQYELRVQKILLVPATPDTALAQEFSKGEAAMIKTGLLLPQAFIESNAITLGRRGEDDEDGS